MLACLHDRKQETDIWNSYWFPSKLDAHIVSSYVINLWRCIAMKIYIYIKKITASCQWVSSTHCLKWLHCTPHSLSSTKLALNVWAAYVLVWLAARVRRWGHNNSLIWVKWPVLALWWCAAPSQRDSLAYLACVAPWQLTGICCDWCRRDKKKVGQRWTGCLYLCEPVSGGGSWDVAEQTKKYRTCAGLHGPVLGTFQTLHLQREMVKTGSWVFFLFTA